MATTASQVPPHDDAAEKGVAGSLLLAHGAKLPGTIDVVASIMDSDDPYSDRIREICRAAIELHSEGIAPDAVTVMDRLASWGRLEECGGHPYLLELLDATPHAAHGEYYAGIVREKACERRAMVAAADLARLMADPTASADAKQRALEAVANLTAGGKLRRPVTLDDLADVLDPRSRPPRRIYPIGSGYEDVDLAPGKVVLVGGAPAAGKTAIATQWTVDALLADDTLTALVANIEMAPGDLLDRQLARLSDVPLRAILERRANLDAVYGTDLDHGVSVLREIGGRLGFARRPHIIDDVVAEARQCKPDLVVLDYIQRIRPCESRDNLREDIGEVMTQARRLADAGACVLALSAVGRAAGGKNGEQYKLGLSSFRESGDLEYSADDAWVMEPDPEREGATWTVEMRRVKARNGTLCELSLEFKGSYQRMTPIESDGLAIHHPDREGA